MTVSAPEELLLLAVLDDLGATEAELRELSLCDMEMDEAELREWLKDDDEPLEGEAFEEKIRDWIIDRGAEIILTEALRATLEARRKDAAMGEAEKREMEGFLQAKDHFFYPRLTLANLAEWGDILMRLPPRGRTWKDIHFFKLQPAWVDINSFHLHKKMKREIVGREKVYRERNGVKFGFEFTPNFVRECIEASKHGKNPLFDFLDSRVPKM